MNVSTAVGRWIRRTIHNHCVALIFGAVTITTLVSLASQPPLRELGYFAAVILVPSQVCLIALWASLSTPPLLARLERAVIWAGGLYFTVLGIGAFEARDAGRAFPAALAVAMGALLLVTSVFGVFLRNHGWRLVQSPEELPAIHRDELPLKFRLLDLLRWMTTLCVFLALGAATVPHYLKDYILRYSPTPASEGIFGVVCATGPMAATAGGVFWLIMVVEDFGFVFRRIMRDRLSWVILMWCGFISAVLILVGGEARTSFVVAMIAGLGFGGPMTASSFLLRPFGYRLKRLPVSPQPVQPPSK